MEQTYIATEDSTHEALTGLAEKKDVAAVFALVAESATTHRAELATVGTETDLTLFGGIFPQLIVDGVVHEEGTLLLGLSQPPEVTHITGLSDAEQGYTDQLPDLLSRGFETAFVLVDAFASRTDALIRALFDTYGVEVTFVGGGTGSLDGPEGPSLFTNAGPLDAGAVMASTTLSSSLGVRHGWEEIAGPLRVTDSDGRTIQALDGEPAFDQYSEIVASHAGRSVDPDDFFESAKAYPFGISRVGGEIIVRDPYRVHEDGSIDCFGVVPEGEFVHVLHGDSDRLVSAARAARDEAARDDDTGTAGSEDATASAESLFFFDCISRVLYLEEGFSEELGAIGSDGEPAVGALTIGEIANDGHGHLEYYNKTAVVASLTDR